jgi:hypothetical protein
MSQSHCIEVEYSDGRIVCFSYGVPVAAFIPKDWARKHDISIFGWICTDVRYSVTTTKHMNQFAPKDNRGEVHDHTLKTLIEPVRRVK